MAPNIVVDNCNTPNKRDVDPRDPVASGLSTIPRSRASVALANFEASRRSVNFDIYLQAPKGDMSHPGSAGRDSDTSSILEKKTENGVSPFKAKNGESSNHHNPLKSHPGTDRSGSTAIIKGTENVKDKQKDVTAKGGLKEETDIIDAASTGAIPLATLSAKGKGKRKEETGIKNDAINGETHPSTLSENAKGKQMETTGGGMSLANTLSKLNLDPATTAAIMNLHSHALPNGNEADHPRNAALSIVTAGNILPDDMKPDPKKPVWGFPGPKDGEEVRKDKNGKITRPIVITKAANDWYYATYTVFRFYLLEKKYEMILGWDKEVIGYGNGKLKNEVFAGFPLRDGLNLLMWSPYPTKAEKAALTQYGRILARAVGAANSGVPIDANYLQNSHLIDLPVDLQEIFESPIKRRKDLLAKIEKLRIERHSEEDKAKAKSLMEDNAANQEWMSEDDRLSGKMGLGDNMGARDYGTYWKKQMREFDDIAYKKERAQAAKEEAEREAKEAADAKKIGAKISRTLKGKGKKK